MHKVTRKLLVLAARLHSLAVLAHVHRLHCDAEVCARDVRDQAEVIRGEQERLLELRMTQSIADSHASASASAAVNAFDVTISELVQK